MIIDMWCDYSGCDAMVSGDGDDAVDAAAYRSGWRRTDDGQDLCPMHADR